MEAAAKRRLPRSIFDAIAGGAGEERTLRSNERAFESYQLVPRVLNDRLVEPELTASVLGSDVAAPIIFAPTSYQRMVHRIGELGIATAAKRAGVLNVLGTVSSYPLEAVYEASPEAAWFQLYVNSRGRRATDSLVGRVAETGFRTLCVTVDTPTSGYRARDVRNGFSLPLKIGPRLVLEGMRRPRWSVDFIRGSVFGVKVKARVRPLPVGEASRLIGSAPTGFTLRDLEWLRARWGGSLVVKGVMRPEDATRAVGAGADGVVVSNHGGRLLDCVPGTVDVLPSVVDAVNGAQVFVDGGVRTGVDVARALALGATACLIGRPALYGLAVGGSGGVERVLALLMAELSSALHYLACDRPSELGLAHLRRL